MVVTLRAIHLYGIFFPGGCPGAAGALLVCMAVPPMASFYIL
jgi:hypothetical protein